MCHAGDNFDRSLICRTALYELCIISTHLCKLLHKHQTGSSYWFSSFYCVRFCAIQPSENRTIYSLSTSGLLAPQSLTTAGQFTLVPLTPSSMTAVFISTGIYKYITDKRMVLTTEMLIYSRSPLTWNISAMTAGWGTELLSTGATQHFYLQYVRVMHVYLTSARSVLST